MKINRVTVSQTIRNLAKLDYKNLKEKTSVVDQTETQYTKGKINQIDDDFQIHTSGNLMRIKVLRGKNLFLRNFINENIDNQFDFTVSSEKGEVMIIINKDTINEKNFEELIKLMYLHTLM